MKKYFFLFAMVIALSGCSTTYDVTFSNGKIIRGVSKPMFDKKTERYQFTLPDGREVKVSASQIRLIEPHGESSQPQFVSPTPPKK